MRLFFTLVLFGMAVLLSAVNIDTRVEPDILTVGGVGELILSGNGQYPPSLEQLPAIPGITWKSGSRRSSSTQWINGKVTRSMTVRYPFEVTKKGSYIIPSQNVKMGKERFRSKAVMFRAVEASVNMPLSSGRERVDSAAADKSGNQNVEMEQVPLKELLFTGLEFPLKKESYYVGETIPVILTLYASKALRLNISEWPEITAAQGNVLFNTYQIRGQDNPKFDRVLQSEEKRSGRSFDLYRFITGVRPISSGKLKLESLFRVGLIEQTRTQRRSSDGFFDDPFFDRMFQQQRVLPQTLKSETQVLEIKPLPPKPEKTYYLGLVGDWKLSASLSKDAARVGEAVTLTIRAEGDSSPETLLAPTLEIPGFRTYTPEVEKQSRSALIRYILIPTEPGSRTLTLNLCSFQPDNGKYQTVAFRKELKIEKAPEGFAGASGGPAVVDTSVQSNPPGQNASAVKAPSGVLYLKKAPYREISIPLWKNRILPGVFIFLAGLAFWMFAELYRIRKKMRENDPGLKRRELAKRMKGALLKKLNGTSPDEICRLDAEISEYVNHSYDLPPGADLKEAAEILKEENPELGEALKTLGESSWSPVAGASITGDFKDRLIRLLGKIVCISLLFSCVFANAAPGREKTASIPMTSEHAMTAYDEGKFTQAEAFYRSKLKQTAPSPELLYNLANCLFQQGRFAQALAYYEEALRLAPRDSDILENLNLTRRKLMRGEKYPLSTPGEFLEALRDSMRPDEWMLFIFCGFALIFSALGARHFTISPIWKSIFVVGCLAVAIPAFAIGWQMASSYNPKRAIVLVRNPAVHALPSVQSGKLDLPLLPGEEVSLEERRLEWVRIRAGNAEGWVKSADILPVLSSAR